MANIAPFDPDKHFLGSLCKYGHDWQGTGKSRRALSNKSCMECNRIRIGRAYIRRRRCAPYTHAEQLTLPLLGKTCTQCEQWKPYSDYTNSAAARDGYRSECRECGKARSKDQHARLKATDPLYAEKNTRRARIHYQANIEAAKDRGKDWIRRNPAKAHAIKANYRARKHSAEGSFIAAEWQELCARYDNRCVACGAKAPLTADHVVPLVHGGTNYILNIQPLCQSCNSRKHAKTVDYRPSRN